MTRSQRLDEARKACQEARNKLLYAIEHLEGADRGARTFEAQRGRLRPLVAHVEGMARELATYAMAARTEDAVVDVDGA